MADIINLDDARKNWTTARADCVTCKHSWQAVFPSGAELGLECPGCGKPHGWAIVPGGDEREKTFKTLEWCMKNSIGPYAP